MFKFVYQSDYPGAKKTLTMYETPELDLLMLELETFLKDCLCIDDLRLGWHICEPSKPKTTKKTKGKAQ
jgi:hypothetical protein